MDVCQFTHDLTFGALIPEENQSPLDHAVPGGGDSQRTFPAILFGDVHAANRTWVVRLRFELLDEGPLRRWDVVEFMKKDTRSD